MMIRCRLYILLILVSLLLPQSAGAAVSYTYDLNGNRLTMTDPTGITYYEYDALNRVTKITNPNGEVTSYTYDKVGQRTSVTLPNGVVTTYTYDAAGRLLDLVHQLNATNVANFSYTYDAVGNRTSMTDEYGTHTYTYDPKYQLIQATHPNQPMETYSYDAVGNRIGGTYDAANRLLEDDNYLYSYDKNGNTTRKVSKLDNSEVEYIWSIGGNLAIIAKYNNMNDATLASMAKYYYDGLGRRVAKRVDGVVTKYVYDGEDILLETDDNDNIQACYTHGPGIDEPISMDRNGQTYYYLTDGLGSVIKLVDAAGIVVQSYAYDSFGNIITQNGSLANPYTYTGREYDPESGLYYYRFRYYDAKTGRFLSEDPINVAYQLIKLSRYSVGPADFPLFLGIPDNLYQYARNNPVNYIDPKGETPLILIWKGIKLYAFFRMAYQFERCLLALWGFEKAFEVIRKTGCQSVENFHLLMSTPQGKDIKEYCGASFLELYSMHASWGRVYPYWMIKNVPPDNLLRSR